MNISEITNIVGFSSPRTGSSYFFKAISNCMSVLDKEYCYLGEALHTKGIKGTYSFENGIIKRENTEKILHKTKRNIIDKNVLLSHMKNSKNSWCIKVFPHHLKKIKNKNVIYNNTLKIKLIRKDIEDQILSSLFMSSEDDVRLEKINEILDLNNQVNKIKADITVEYESLTGDPKKDMLLFFDEEIVKLANFDDVPKKRYSKDDKIQKLKDIGLYDDFIEIINGLKINE